MTQHQWRAIRSQLQRVLDTEANDLHRRFERLDRAVGDGTLNIGDVAGGIDLDELSTESARRLVRLWETLSEHRAVGRDPGAVAVASILVRHGSYPMRRITKEPGLAIWLSHTRWRRAPMPRDELAEELRGYVDAARLDAGSFAKRQFKAVLRRFRHRQLLRVFLREIEGASLRDTTAEVADVAEVCLQAALDETARLLDDPAIAGDICIFGMGKLGGRELNFSSDVDLIFAASDDIVGPRRNRARRVVRDVVDIFDDVTDDGRVFRVDLRLRPEGSRGRLLPSKSGLVDYYLNWGSTWERGVWLKARVVAGSTAIGDEILERLEPFLFRRHLDFDALDELRRMKEMIDEESRADDFVHAPKQRPTDGDNRQNGRSTSPFKSRLLDKFGSSTKAPSATGEAVRPRSGVVNGGDGETGTSGWDVKIGRGGIREIEFFVQALQLVHCGTRPNLRVRTTLRAIDRLLYAGLLSAAEHEQLTGAYDLFRRLEHRIQMESDRQTHRIPKGDTEFADLAGRMAMAPAQLGEVIERGRDDVRSMFERLFEESPRHSARATVGERREGALERVVGLAADRLLDQSVLQRLREAGFSRPRQVAGQLQVLRQKEHGPFSESPTSADPQLARYLLSAVRDAPSPEDALGQLVRFSTSVGDTPSMWSMLAENPHAARLLIHLFGSSPPIGGLLAEEPDLFERLIYGGSAQVVRQSNELEAELRRRLSAVNDRSRRLGRIRRFHREEIVRIALHEVAGAVEIETTCRQLTELAQLVISALFREVVAEYAAAHDDVELRGEPATSLGLSVVALGKLGGGEMGFGSDLDVIFIYDSSADSSLNHQSATRIARRLVRAMSTTTALGDLYEVDLRLRPSGTQGTLVVGYNAWLDYHRQRAEFWERLALVRARPLTGSTTLRQQIEEGRRRLAFQRKVPRSGRAKVLEMRGKLLERTSGGAARFDVKFDRGGLLDVEFLIQWLQLCHGVEASTVDLRSTFAVLEAWSEDNTHVEAIEFDGLLRDYRSLRRLECRLDISGARRVVPDQGPARRSLARQMGHQGRDEDEQFGAELSALRSRIHRIWCQIFDIGDSEL